MPELKAWEDGWEAGRTHFHRNLVHEYLIDFKDRLLVKKPSRVFVPLCGKSLDIKWLMDEGHEVVGVEGVTKGILEFFQEQNLPYTESNVPGLEDAKLFQTSDGKIKLYKCDFFQFSRDIAGCFDAVWDRGSLVAIDECNRPRYGELILSLLNPGGRILFEAVVYNPEERNPKGPPFAVTDEAVKELYSARCAHELLADSDILPRNQRFKEKGLTWMRMRAHLLTLNP